MCGKPVGRPVVVLHRSPGAGCSPAQRRFFYPSCYRITRFDQRGAGRSHPLGSVENNDNTYLVADIEIVRQHLGEKRWLVFGGSWGARDELFRAMTNVRCRAEQERNMAIRAFHITPQ
jgi:proline iminopeptidase